MRLISMTTSAATYLVPTSRFSITIIVAHPCWIAIRSPWNAATPSFTSTLVPSAVREPIDIDTSASVVLAAQAIAIWITEGSTVLGSVDDPVVGLSYVFESDS